MAKKLKLMQEKTVNMKIMNGMTAHCCRPNTTLLTVKQI